MLFIGKPIGRSKMISNIVGLVSDETLRKFLDIQNDSRREKEEPHGTTRRVDTS